MSNQKNSSGGEGGRTRGVQVSCPLVHGSLAWYQGEAHEEGKSHQWTVYVRGLQFEDLSHYLRKVVFVLHESFVQPIRVCEQPPFSVTEFGWGEFEVLIKLHLHDRSAKPIELRHLIRLFPPAGPPTTKKPVVHEVYDELVFVNPSKAIATQLAAGPPRLLVTEHANIAPHVSLEPFVAQERKEIVRITEAHSIVLRSIQLHQKNLRIATSAIAKAKRALTAAPHARSASTPSAGLSNQLHTKEPDLVASSIASSGDDDDDDNQEDEESMDL